MDNKQLVKNLKKIRADAGSLVADEYGETLDAAIAAVKGEVTMDLRYSLDPPGYYIVRVLVNGIDVVGIWCDKISVYPGKPPMFDLIYKGFSVAGVSGQMTVDRYTLSRMPGDTIAALGEYCKVAEPLDTKSGSKTAKAR